MTSTPGSGHDWAEAVTEGRSQPRAGGLLHCSPLLPKEELSSASQPLQQLKCEAGGAAAILRGWGKEEGETHKLSRKTGGSWDIDKIVESVHHSKLTLCRLTVS